MASLRRSTLPWLLIWLAGLLMLALPRPVGGMKTELLEVSTTADHGPGSLRAALEHAARHPERPHRIQFGDRHGPFSRPEQIKLEAPLPAIVGDVVIDGFIRGLLWRAYGVTVSGQGSHALIEIKPQGRLHLRGITLVDGHGEQGGGLHNRGQLIVEGVTLSGHRASRAGGAIANLDGELWVINTTLIDNQAPLGGAIANLDGRAQLIHLTLSDNVAEKGDGIYNAGDLRLANSILAGQGGAQCVSASERSVDQLANLIQGPERGCGAPLLDLDPQFESLGHYNGPTRTLAVAGTSPVINRAAAIASVDHRAQVLRWDQRGNGDPRFAGGFADLGAFERQGPLPNAFVVDSRIDDGQRLCNPLVRGSCSLPAALALAVAARDPVPVRFSPEVFPVPEVLVLESIPAGADMVLILDGQAAVDLLIRVPAPVAWQGRAGVRIESTPGGGQPR